MNEWIGYYMDNNIVIMILSPYSSHLTQSLEVAIFSPLKRHMTTKIESFIRMGVNRIQKMEWTMTFIEIHKETFTVKNIKGDFCDTGIHPFLPTKILNRVSRSEISESRTPSSMPIITTPLTEAILTSSPTDINAIYAANMALNQLIQSDKPLSTSTKKYASCVIQSSERLYASKTILEKEKEELQAMTITRKQYLSEKRKTIGDESLITTKRILNGVREAEATTRGKGVKMQKESKKSGSKISKRLSDESKEDSNSNDHGEVEIMDCIEVQM